MSTTANTTSSSPTQALPTSLLPKCDGPPYNAQPDINGVPTLPKDINIAMIGGQNVSGNEAMIWCCYPNHVQLLDSCFLWCQIPEPREGEKDAQGSPKFQHAEDIVKNFTACLRADHAWDSSENLGVQMHIPNFAGEGVKPPGMVRLAGLMIGLLGVISFVLG